MQVGYAVCPPPVKAYTGYMEQKSAKPDPLKISMVFRQIDWDTRQRQAFMEQFSDTLEKQTLSLWTGTLRRLPRGLSYEIENQGFEGQMLRLSFAPGFEGGPLRVTATMRVPPAIIQYHERLMDEGVEQARQQLSNSWLARYVMPAIGWLLRVPGAKKEIAELDEKILAEYRQELSMGMRQRAAEFWAQHAVDQIISGLLHSAIAGLETVQPPGQTCAPLLVEANGRTLEIGLGGLTQPAQDTPPPRAVLRA